MRLDPMQLDVETFPVQPEPDMATLKIANSQMPCGGTTSPCLNSEMTCDPACIA